ncbi:MAG: ATP-binding protein [Bacteroidia bacterium]
MSDLISGLQVNRNVQLFVFQSSLKSIDAMEVLLRRIRRQMRLPVSIYSSIWISVNEALSNAIIHGNKFDLNKKVRVLMQFKRDQWICFTIKDEGHGFDYARFTELPGALTLKPYGSGVMFMKKLADATFFSDNGTTVDLYFKLR